jgi:hypothetical protein
MDYRARRTVTHTVITHPFPWKHVSTVGLIIGVLSLIHKCYTNPSVLQAVTSFGEQCERGRKFEQLVKGIK